MDYSKIYDALCSRVHEPEVAGDMHHRIPRYAGGTDDVDNMVKLTRREHILAHRLLFRIHGDKRDNGAVRLLGGLVKPDSPEVRRQKLKAKSARRHAQMGEYYNRRAREAYYADHEASKAYQREKHKEHYYADLEKSRKAGRERKAAYRARKKKEAQDG